jgi:hypothetical protein
MPGHDNNDPIELSDDELETVAGGMLTLRSGTGTSGLADGGIAGLTSELANRIGTILNVGGQR